jgi:hypothetical protein
VSTDLQGYVRSWKWTGLHSLIRVHRSTHQGGPGGELIEETHDYLSSHSLAAPVIAKLIHQHWSNY